MYRGEKSDGEKDGDQMRLKQQNQISLEELQDAYVEEYRAVVAERIRQYIANGGQINESFLDKIKGGAKGFMKGYGKLIKNYGDFVADLYGYSGEEEIPDKIDAPEPEEMQAAVQDGDVAEIRQMMADIQKQIDAMKSKAGSKGDEAEKKLDAIEDYADKIEAAAGGGEGGEQAQAKPAVDEPKISAALLDILDVSMEKWEKISAATRDKELKAAMDKVEAKALAEKLKRLRRKK